VRIVEYFIRSNCTEPSKCDFWWFWKNLKHLKPIFWRIYKPGLVLKRSFDALKIKQTRVSLSIGLILLFVYSFAQTKLSVLNIKLHALEVCNNSVTHTHHKMISLFSSIERTHQRHGKLWWSYGFLSIQFWILSKHLLKMLSLKRNNLWSQW
jgi:hypothetical protein